MLSCSSSSLSRAARQQLEVTRLGNLQINRSQQQVQYGRSKCIVFRCVVSDYERCVIVGISKMEIFEGRFAIVKSTILVSASFISRFFYGFIRLSSNPDLNVITFET
jgi:hypothetical protein